MTTVGSEKFSVSTTQELFEALERLGERREQDRSSLIEMLLREHPMVRGEIRRLRSENEPSVGQGRSREEIEALAEVAARQWEKREEAGEVAFVDR